MSRIGNRVLSVPANVTVTVDNNVVTVKGPKGELSTKIHENINVEVKENEITVTRTDDNYKNFHGTINSVIKNMIKGVTDGFQLKGNKLVVNAGYSHPVEVDIPTGVKVDVTSNTELTISGIDKCLVGEFAANIRKIRQPEPYKGKGIRYTDEVVHRKEGKKAA